MLVLTDGQLVADANIMNRNRPEQVLLAGWLSIPPLKIISPECKISGTMTSAEPNETDNQDKYVVRYLCPIKLMLGQKLCGIFNRVERGTSRHAKKPAIIDTVDSERDKGS